MIATAGLVGVCLVLQVPSPTAPAKVSGALHSEHRAIIDGESASLIAIATKLAADGLKDQASEVRNLTARAPSPDGAIRFLPLAEIVPGVTKGLDSIPNGRTASWRGEVSAVRTRAAQDLFDLAKRAARSNPKHFALADRCLRDVIARSPDHPEARRFLGFVSYREGWATPFAVSQVKAGMTPHPVYGWVKSSWVPHLEKGELPARGGLPNQETWLPAEQADEQRREFAQGWEISTEHFQIKTNARLSEAIVFGRSLEILHEVFESLFADVIGDNLPLARRLISATTVDEVASEAHQISYFATRDEYISHVRPLQGDDVEESLGIYIRSQKGKRGRGRAFFFRDPNGQLDVTATLHHEVSHQLLFESGVAGPNDFLKNVGNYWVFEGLGTFFETLTASKEGEVQIGGLVGPRLNEARRVFKDKESLVPLAAFIRYDKAHFNDGNILRHYQQANALATFLMSARAGAYREGFLDYVRSACKGTLKRATGKSLEDRVDRSASALEDELIAYLGTGRE